MTPADDGYEMVEEVEGRPPAEVLVGQCAFLFLKNPVGWHIRKFLLITVGRGLGLRLRCSGSWRWGEMGNKWEGLVVGLGVGFRLHCSRS